jgi:hypothetical protein
MARTANPIETEEFRLAVNVQTVWYLDQMVGTGLFGNNRAEAIKIALLDHIKLLIARETIGMAPPLPQSVPAVS